MSAEGNTPTLGPPPGSDAFNPGLQLTHSNMFSGAGMLDSWGTLGLAAEKLSQTDKANKGEVAALSVEIGLSVVSGVLDTAAFVLDPFGKLIAAGLGWLWEHIGVLKQILNEVFGNPDEIKKFVEYLKKTGKLLNDTAKEFDASHAQVKQWSGEGYDAFANEMKWTRDRIDLYGNWINSAGTELEVWNAFLSAFRGLVRDMITTVLGDIIATALFALALAPATLGASIAAAIGKILAMVGLTGADYAAKIAKVIPGASKALTRQRALNDVMRQTDRNAAGTAGHEMHDLPPGERPPSSDGASTHSAPASEHSTPASDHSTPASEHTDTRPESTASSHDDIPPELRDWRDHYDPERPGGRDEAPSTNDRPSEGEAPSTRPSSAASDHPSNTGSDRPTSPASDRPSEGPAPYHEPKPSPLRPAEAPWMKAHEGKLSQWFGSNFTGKAADATHADGRPILKPGTKVPEEWWKQNANSAYPWLKGMSDAKSSKNYVGQADKLILGFDKEITNLPIIEDKVQHEKKEPPPGEQPAH